MYYYKNKVKPILILCLVVIAMSISICVCLWDDTSIQKLKVDGGAATGDYVGKSEPIPSDIKLGERITIDGISYTVGHKGSDMITVYSDNAASRGVLSLYDSREGHFAYFNSEVFRSVEAYYAKLKDEKITLGSTTYGKVSEYVVGHKDFGWNLWLPSVREINLYHSGVISYIEGSSQPVMEWYNTDDRRKEYVDNNYWLRSPREGIDSSAFFVLIGSGLHYTSVSANFGVVRVALNLKIS